MALPNEDWKTEDADALLDAIVTLESREEASLFLRDLCTRRELEEMSQRWRIVRLLNQGIPYREIAADVGTSTATITRINQWLHHGMGGYSAMLDKHAAG
ncbi:trp operon repressor [bacterium BMS3Bbin02]|nr:trp operon repressor [bacterium BMS3Bbin02]